MRRIVSNGASSPSARPPPQYAPAERVVIPHDPVNEGAIIALAAGNEVVLAQLSRRLVPDHFLVRENREAWAALCELQRRGLVADRASLRAVAGDAVADHVAALAEALGPAVRNAEWHAQNLLWDAARAAAATGPVPAFLEALRDPTAEPDKVRSLARQVSASFDGHDERKFLHAPGELVRSQMLEIEKRVAGHATYPFGIPGLDFHDPLTREKRRMIPGLAPGKVTVVTGTPGTGKSSTIANIVLGAAFPGGVESDAVGRSVCYGAWEMGGGMTLELLACISLGWSRSDLLDPQGALPDAPINTHEGRVLLQGRMHRISTRVRFMAMPFRRSGGERPTNDRNLDVLQGYLADAGCDIFVGDLWKRCLRDLTPDAEEDALIRQQAMLEELRVHGILAQQQRAKDVEARSDPRPTREGIKGSGAWFEVADNIIGVHRPAFWKRVEDDKIEAIILKQRYGQFPLAVELDWDRHTGRISGGRAIEYERPGEANELDGEFLAQRPKGKGRYPR